MDIKIKVTNLIFKSAIVFIIAMFINFGIGFKLGMEEKIENDPYSFLQLARTIADGGGYVTYYSFWPGLPTMRLLPGWPFSISIALRLFPDCSPDTVLRVLSLSINSLVAVTIFLLTFMLFRRPSVAFVSGIAYGLHPTGLFISYIGCSEPLFLLLISVGLLFLLMHIDSPLHICIGFLLLGCSCLVRANFILFIFFAIFFGGILWRKEKTLFSFRKFSIFCLGIILFIGPTFLWTLRNYKVCGNFPVISSAKGATFYGANNPVVANTLGYWGYWVFPDSIPGEKTMAELSKTMSEYEVDEYYFGRGKEYLRQNWFTLPRLLLGKFIRAYVPIPFAPIWETYVASLYRWLLYLGTVIGLFVVWRDTSLRYQVCFLSMVLTNFVTVLIFWGYVRFALALEPFFLPFFGIGMVACFDPAFGKIRRMIKGK